MGLRADQSQRLVALFVLGVLLLTYPLLALFNLPVSVFGIPLLYAYLFGAWAGLILLLGLTARAAAPAGEGAAAPERAGAQPSATD